MNESIYESLSEKNPALPFCIESFERTLFLNDLKSLYSSENEFLLLPESHPVLFGSHAAADALLNDEPDHVGNKPFV